MQKALDDLELIPSLGARVGKDIALVYFSDKSAVGNKNVTQ
jgi:hypothetical protein